MTTVVVISSNFTVIGAALIDKPNPNFLEERGAVRRWFTEHLPLAHDIKFEGGRAFYTSGGGAPYEAMVAFKVVPFVTGAP